MLMKTRGMSNAQPSMGQDETHPSHDLIRIRRSSFCNGLQLTALFQPPFLSFMDVKARKKWARFNSIKDSDSDSGAWNRKKRHTEASSVFLLSQGQQPLICL